MSLSPEVPLLARLIWRRLEPFHAMTYFAKESQVAFEAVGMKGFWMGYFAGRAAAMGPVGPNLVTATFFNFHPSRVVRAVPDCWSITTPHAILRARVDGMVNAINANVAIDVEMIRTIEPLVRTLAEAARAEVGGRPLFAAHAELPWPEDGPALQAGWAATLIREHRGDGHIAALVNAGVAPCEALVLQSVYGSVTREVVQTSRKWSDDEWDVATDSLASRGWLNGDGTGNDVGREALATIERRTDELASKPILDIGVDAAAALAEAALPLAQAAMASGVVPTITPIFGDDLR